VAKALLAQIHEFEKSPESILRKEEKCAHAIAVETRYLAPKCVAALKAICALLFLCFQPRPRGSSGFPRISIHAVADGNVDIGVMFSELKVNKQVDFCYVGGVIFMPYVIWEFFLSGAASIV